MPLPCEARDWSAGNVASSGGGGDHWVAAARAFVRSVTCGDVDIVSPLNRLGTAIGDDGDISWDCCSHPSATPLNNVISNAMMLGAESDEIASAAATAATRLITSTMDTLQNNQAMDESELDKHWQSLYDHYFSPKGIAENSGRTALSFVETSTTAAAAIMRFQTRRGNWQAAVDFFEKSYNKSTAETAAAINAMIAGNQQISALDLLEGLPPAVRGDLEMASLLNMVSKRDGKDASPDGQLWGRALKLFSETATSTWMPQTATAHNNAIGILGKHNRWAETINVVQNLMDKGNTMPSHGVASANSVTVTKLCYALRNNWQVALHYTSLLVSRNNLSNELDRVALTQMAVTCASGSRWEEAARVCALAERNSVVLDPDVYCRVIVVCNKQRQNGVAAQLLKRLTRSNNRDVTGRALNSMLQHCASNVAAHSWLEAMKARNLPLEFESYETLIDKNSKSGRWEKAMAFAEEMKQRDMMPSQRSYEFMLVSMSRRRAPWLQCLALYNEMEKVHVAKPQGSTTAFKAVTSACLDQGAKDAAHKLFVRMMRKGVGAL